MSTSRPGLRALLGVLVAVAIAVPLLRAGTSGAVYTTLGNGESVDHNIYDAKEDVFLNGGPQHGGTSGLDPANTSYYFMVTDPSGSVLLSTDDIECRQVWVNTAGRVYGVPPGLPPAACTTGYHAVGALHPGNGAIPVQLLPFNDTPNAGGEYKVWAIPVADYDPVRCRNNFGFCAAASKTDNFKVEDNRLAYVKVCKFEDKDANGIQDAGEALIPHWPLNATGVDGPSSVQTGDDGCFTFTAITFLNGVANVTIAEGTRGNNWVRTAPADGTYGPFTVSDGVISVALLRGDTLVAPYFGNYSPGGGDYKLEVTKTAATSYTKTYTWTIDKAVDQSRLNTAGLATANYTVEVRHDAGQITNVRAIGTIKVSNTDPESAAVADVTDLVNNGGTCTVSGGTAVEIPAGGHVTLDYECTYPDGAVPSDGLNTASAAKDGGGLFTGTAVVEFSKAVVTEINRSVTVVDSLKGTLGTLDVDADSPTSYTYAITFTDPAGTCTDHPNTAAVKNLDDVLDDDSAAVTVCVGADLNVAKTAVPTFVRRYNWSIDKSVDQTRILYALGGSATFTYTVNAAQTGFTDSAWGVAGTITVSNPNDWEAITADVTDVVSDVAGLCTVTGGTAVVVPADGSVTLDYACRFTATPVASGTNTATATWDQAAFFTPNGTASGRADYAFGAPPTTTNQTIDVTDSFKGALGSLTATDGPEWASASYTYTRTIDNATGGTCTAYDNTATITQTGQSDSERVTVCVGVDLGVTKTATPSFVRTYLWRIGKSADKTRIEHALGGSATFNYTVDAAQTGYADSGWGLAGTIRVTNPNDWQAITADVTDAVSDVAGACVVTGGAKVAIPASGSATLNYVCTFTAMPGSSGTNTATAAWDQAASFTPHGTATGTAGFTFVAPTTKVNDVIHVTDSFQGALGLLTATDAPPWASASYLYARTITNAPGGTCSSYDNTATITETRQSDSETVTVCVGVNLTAAKTATPSFTRTYLWRIGKAADRTRVDYAQGGSATFNYTVNAAQTGYTDSAWALSGLITVTNPNDWQAITVSLSDAVPGGVCEVTNGAAVSVPAGGSVSSGYTCTFAALPASGTNVATITWDAAAFHTPTGSVAAQAAFAFTAPTARVNQTVHVTDSYAGPLGTLTATDGEPWSSAAYQYSRTINNAPGGTCTVYDNTATMTETGQTASQRVTVCVGVNLTASKTAVAAFHRAYLWAIAKGVDRTLVEQPGGSATFNYTVNANQTGVTDSGWTVTGTITVTNPNDWQAITADVTDVLSDTGGACAVTGGTGVVLAASGSAARSYICTFAMAPSAAAGTNTATVAWNGAAAFTPASSATATAGYRFGLPTTTTNKTITVTDTFDGTLVTLGTMTGVDAVPWASRTFTYAHSVPNAPVPGTCQAYNNTAAITQTGQTDSESVRICNTMTGARTIGFWQNKNGQGIIKGGADMAGVCNAGVWLTSFPPFQDLRVGSDCDAVAKYVATVIKAANSGGATMNAMLKAQMLATALDVYFSDWALGGNMLGAPAPIGAYVVDLTHVNKPIGSAFYENVSAAFGATSMTVYQMLVAAAGQSTPGGAFWYGNVKAMQELAKDAFDAINNEVAWFPPTP